MNVLITSAGRRTSLLNAFQEAARPWNGTVFAADLDPLAPACHLADEAFCLPLITDDAYIPVLCEHIRKHSIGLIVPTIDTELPVLAGAIDVFEEADCRALLSTASFIHLTSDKWLTARTFSELGVNMVPTWLPSAMPATLPDRLFVKPRRGSASQQAFSIQSNQIQHALALVSDPIIQPHIQADEITVDALFDFEGELLHYVPRLRVRTLAGESIQGMTLPHHTLAPWLTEVLQVAGKLGARGPITLQAFLTEGTPLLSEINPRFGGGFPLTQAAGGCYPKWILQMMHGEKPSAVVGQYQSSLFMTRYYTELFTDQPDAGRNGAKA